MSESTAIDETRYGALSPGVGAGDDTATVRAVTSNSTTRVFSVHLRPGEVLARHRAPGPLTLLVVRGEIDLELEDGTRRLSTGECCLLGAGAAHALSGAGSEEAVTVGVLSITAGDPLGMPAPERDVARDALTARDPSVVDLGALLSSASGRGVVWSLEAGAGVNVNLARLEASERIGEHANDELDVVLVGLSGSGGVEIEGEVHRLEPGQLVRVPAGTRRAVAAASSVFGYLTVHAERAGLSLRRRH